MSPSPQTLVAVNPSPPLTLIVLFIRTELAALLVGCRSCARCVSARCVVVVAYHCWRENHCCCRRYFLLPWLLTISNQGSQSIETDLLMWFQRNKLDTNTGKVKPARAGSSIGVTVAYGVADSLRKANKIITEEIDHKVLVEIFLEGGREFTAIVLDVGTGVECCPVALLPTEVELQVNDDIDLKEKDATAYSVGCSGNHTWYSRVTQ